MILRHIRKDIETQLPMLSSYTQRLNLYLVPKGDSEQYTVFAVFTADFLRKTASCVFRIGRTLGMVRTQLYLSCSELWSIY
jgi:hypothetical protein